MGWRTFLGRDRSGSSAPSFEGPVPAKEFLEATGLTQAHLDRYEGEGLVELAYVKGAGRMVQNPSEFVGRVMAPMPDDWPPDLPALDDGLQQRYALDGDQSVAERILQPFRFDALADRWTDIVALARPSIRLVAGGDLAAGSSRVGGTPDVPPGFVWPRFDQKPLGFVGQVNLVELQKVCPSTLLPDRGLLSFYYDAKQEAWGFDPKDKGRWAVLHLQSDVTPISTVPQDLPSEGVYEPGPLTPVGELTLPEFDSLEIERLELDQRQRSAYTILSGELERARMTRGPIHRLLGWPEQVQHDPAIEVQLPAHGIYSGSPEGYRSDEGKKLMAERDVWQLLFQVDTDNRTRMMWGDVGRLYYMMERDDLSARKWDECWFNFQCS